MTRSTEAMIYRFVLSGAEERLVTPVLAASQEIAQLKGLADYWRGQAIDNARHEGAWRERAGCLERRLKRLQSVILAAICSLLGLGFAGWMVWEAMHR